MTDKKTEALKLALEALEVATTPLAKDRQEVLLAQAAIREALADQPAQQQEPVAVVKALPMGHNQSDMHYAECQHLPVGTLLYTSPPASKPWVGLTQQDINIAFDDTQEGGGFDDFARAIETKLREKNAPQQSKEDA